MVEYYVSKEKKDGSYKHLKRCFKIDCARDVALKESRNKNCTVIVKYYTSGKHYIKERYYNGCRTHNYRR